MTTNIYPDHYTAADIIADVIWTDKGTLRGTVTEAAQALKDSGRIIPDLPEPTIWRSGEDPLWFACDTDIEPAGYEGRVLVHDVDISWDIGADDARDLAYALLAAANYTERN